MEKWRGGRVDIWRGRGLERFCITIGPTPEGVQDREEVEQRRVAGVVEPGLDGDGVICGGGVRGGGGESLWSA